MNENENQNNGRSTSRRGFIQSTATAAVGAHLAMRQGRDADGEAFAARALAINETTLGREHPLVATDLENLVTALSRKGRHAAAMPLYERALAIEEKALGATHPNNLSVRESLRSLRADR